MTKARAPKSTGIEKLTKIVEDFRSEVSSKFDRVDMRFDQVDDRFEQVDKRFEQIDDRFEQVDKRFEQIDDRFEQVDKRFEQIDDRFEQVDKRFEQIDDRFEQVDKKFGQVDLKFVQIDSRLDQGDKKTDGIIQILVKMDERIHRQGVEIISQGQKVMAALDGITSMLGQKEVIKNHEERIVILERDVNVVKTIIKSEAQV